MPYARLDTSCSLDETAREQIHDRLWSLLQEVYGVNKALMEISGDHEFFYNEKKPCAYLEVKLMDRFPAEKHDLFIERAYACLCGVLNLPAEDIVINLIALPIWGKDGKVLHI